MTTDTVTTSRTEREETASNILFSVLTLIHAALDLSSTAIGSEPDMGGLTDPECRMSTLLCMAREKTADAIRTLDV